LTNVSILSSTSTRIPILSWITLQRHTLNIPSLPGTSNITMALETEVEEGSAPPRILEGVDIQQDVLPIEVSVSFFVNRD
jgi:hypothetical protein